MNGTDETTFMLQDHPVDEGRDIRVVIIGAGVSGIMLYIRILQYVPAARVTLFEKNPECGGTWYENRYPGVTCDIPSHVYQYTFEPNTEWSKYFSPGSEILSYVQGVARKYGVDRKIKYNTKVIGATWIEADGVWQVKTEKRMDSGEIKFEETSAEVVISAVGLLNNWRWPAVEGLKDFKGTLLHSANWDSSWDWSNKKVALLGCGSSAIQILPHLQQKCSSVYNFVRGGTWISQPFGSTFTEDVLAKGTEPGNYTYTDEEKARFRNDPQHYQQFRKEMESFINKDYPCLFPGTVEQQVSSSKIEENMTKKLSNKPGLFEILKPGFKPGCRRLTPGPGYLEALVKDNVHLIQNPISHITETSVVTQDGTQWEVDAIACATGFDSSHMPRFPILGRNGATLSSRWKYHAAAYMSHSVPEFPNYFFVGGPNSATGGGSLLLILESVMEYTVKAVAKISREHLKSMEVKESSLSWWTSYLDQYFPKTVHVGGCTSWYKVNGRIVGLWPGSSLHAMKTLENPRWEDFDYETLGNRSGLEWIGNGWTIEDVKRGNLSYYLDHSVVPPVPSQEVLSKQP